MLRRAGGSLGLAVLLIATVTISAASIAAPRVTSPAPTDMPAPTQEPSATFHWIPAESTADAWVTTMVIPTDAPTPVPTKDHTGGYGYARCPAPSGRWLSVSPGAQAYLRSRVSAIEYNCAWQIIAQESGWDPTVQHGNGTIPDAACGLPQARPCSQMGLGAAWASNPNAQIDWFLRYVHNRYETCFGAYAFKFGYVDIDGV